MEPSGFVAATAEGICVAALDARGWSLTIVGEEAVLALGACGGRVFAGTSHGLLCSDDGGFSWCAKGLEDRRVTAIGCGHGVVYAGTKGPRLFRSDDGGESWTELPELRALRRWYWWTPVSKPNREAEVSSIVVSRSHAGIVVAGIEAGAVVRSTDFGHSWEGHKRNALRDCHTLALNPNAPGYVYQGGAGGGAFSRDDGQTWLRARRGLGRAWYGWAAAGDAADPETRFLSAARGVRRAHGPKPHAWIFRARSGRSWRPMLELDAMPYVLISLEDRLVAGLSDGRVLVSETCGESWTELPFRFSSVSRALLAT